LYYTAFGITTPVGGRPVHRLGAGWLECMGCIPRTCPGFSVPEPYRSHDWALVPANPVSKAEY